MGAPRRRIIHARGIRLPLPARLGRLGLITGKGYFKCGSDPWAGDWASDVRVLASDGAAWRTLLDLRGVPRPSDEKQTLWYELGNVECVSALVQMRRSAVDGWWPSWNLAMSGVILEGGWDGGPPTTPAVQNGLTLEDCSLKRLPRGIEARVMGGEVRYRTRFLQVGFRPRRAAFSFLSFDGEGLGRVDRNLLAFAGFDMYPGMLREHFGHGVRLAPLAGPPLSSYTAHDAEGTARFDGAKVDYVVRMERAGQVYRLHWEVKEDRLVLHAEREGARPLRAWESSVWHMPFDSRVTPVSALGEMTYAGETGMVRPPILAHAPGFGTLLVSSTGPTLWRSDSARPVFVSSVELKLGEEPGVEGDTVLLPGRHMTDVELAVTDRRLASVRRGAPAEVERAVRRCAVTALPFRPDTATLSNNGNSMHAPICMDNWSALAVRMGEVVPGLPAHGFLRASLERWLDGGQGYASGPSATPGHSYDDEYIMTPAACLLGIAQYLEVSSDRTWLAERADEIGSEIAKMRARDADGDGLVESVFRLGKSGSHQWSTNWFDVITYGWKDAFVNALTYQALRKLAAVLPRLGRGDLAAGLPAWADKLKESYHPTFFNPATGWYAGWRCAEDKLHDYAFMTPNGAAITAGLAEGAVARGIIEKLWNEMGAKGFSDFRLGLPWNLRPIPAEDMGTWNTGRPMGFYANGGVTLSQARHFIGALYAVGMTEEADRVLVGTCASLADGSAFGGCATGLDLHTWDGTPCGYEGLLCDQLGVLAVALERFGDGGRGT
jgi:hypothetical protein